MATNGVFEYVKGVAVIYFEPDLIACAYCPVLETYARAQCRLTGEYIIDTRSTVGRWCPLQLGDKDGNLSDDFRD